MTDGTSKILKKLDREIASIFKKNKGWVVEEGEEIVDFNRLLDSHIYIISLITWGIPYSLFSIIQEYTPLSEREWSAILDLSTKSLLRYRQDGRSFGPLQSEKIIEMAEVTRIGLDLFGDIGKFRLWLETPNFALGNKKPADLLRDSYGKELVLGVLTRVQHGIFI